MAAGFVRSGRIETWQRGPPWPPVKREMGDETRALVENNHTRKAHKWLKDQSADERDVAFATVLGEETDIRGAQHLQTRYFRFVWTKWADHVEASVTGPGKQQLVVCTEYTWLDLASHPLYSEFCKCLEAACSHAFSYVKALVDPTRATASKGQADALEERTCCLCFHEVLHQCIPAAKRILLLKLQSLQAQFRLSFYILQLQLLGKLALWSRSPAHLCISPFNRCWTTSVISKVLQTTVQTIHSKLHFRLAFNLEVRK
jgi:hypothetical protein